MSNNPQLAAFEKSAYNFLEELKKLPLDIELIHPSETRKIKLLIHCIKAMTKSVNEEIEKIEIEKEKINKKIKSNPKYYLNKNIL